MSTPNSAPSTPSRRRGDIEGLRALAVVLVVAYHCGIPGMTGGFIGVDVFFALSGYLMTGLLLDERSRTGRIGLLAFYARRVRRLLPAAAVVTLATLVAGIAILDPLSVRRLAGDVVSVATYSANIRFALQGTDYLQSDGAESALLHFWSLAVEEQFYLVWPILLALATFAATRPRRRATIVLAVVTAVSLTMSIALTRDQAVWSFFGLHTRAWEFGLGGLAALIGGRVGDRAVAIRAGAGWVGLVAIVVAAMSFDESSSTPGWRALVPVLGAVAVLDAVVSPHGPRVALDRRPAVWWGGRSYSIYLWHWPPLVLVPAALERELTVAEAVMVALAATVVAVVVQMLVEDPLRHARLLVARGSATAAMGLALTATLVVAAAVTARTADLDGRGTAAGEPTFVDGVLDTGTDQAEAAGRHEARPAPVNLTPPLAEVVDDQPAIYATGCHLDIPTETPAGCRVGAGRRTVALFGDSHAAQWFPAVEAIAGDVDATVLVMTKSGCPAAAVTTWNEILRRDYDECDSWRESVLSGLEARPPDVVVVADYPQHALSPDRIADGAAHERLWRDGTRETLERLAATGTRVVMIGPVPRSAGRRPECVAENLDDVTRCSARRARVVREPYVGIARDEAERVGALFVDPTDWLCDDRRCPAVAGRYLVYRDSSHLTTAFARALASELERFIARGLDESAE